jgi:hypothetical protein
MGIQEVEDLRVQLREMTASRDHWKANHDNQVARARVLMDRTDLPLERVKAYQHIVELEKEMIVQESEISLLRKILKMSVKERIDKVIDIFTNQKGDAKAFTARLLQVKTDISIEELRKILVKKDTDILAMVIEEVESKQ